MIVRCLEFGVVTSFYNKDSIYEFFGTIKIAENTFIKVFNLRFFLCVALNITICLILKSLNRFFIFF